MARDLFSYNYDLPLPPQDVFPINEPAQDRTVKQIIIGDIKNSEEYLVVTGFTSLSHLIEMFGAVDYPKLEKLKVAIGYDPDERVAKRLAHYSLTTEIKNFWLKQNISIKLCGPIINLIEKIKEKKIEFRVKDKLHAKIYVGSSAAILGSSNFSKSGTINQTEANIRVNKLSDEQEKKQYESIQQLAEYYYNQATEYNEALIELLGKLLKEATWQEALARAIAEILENRWMKDYQVLSHALASHNLWPSQKMGIAKAMKIIQDQGRVLLADPTGSGKTKLATTLAYTLFHWLWENGMKDRSTALIICPPQVVDNWLREQEPFKVPNKIESMGKLSMGKEKNKRQLQKDIERKDILIIDEAHNYLSTSSQRSRAINPRAATHVILSTATPINKKPEDLLRLVELLDIDNLSDQDIAVYKKLRRSRNGIAGNKDQLQTLKGYINQFIVRRTKKELNKMILREPEHYKNRNSHRCSYPETIAELYDTGETAGDIELARQISELAFSLKGVHYLQGWKFPLHIKSREDRKKYIRQRFVSATALATFTVRACLRSSSCALTEYLHGTKEANDHYKIHVAKQHTGNIIEKIRKCKSEFDSINFPLEYGSEGNDWIMSKNEYKKVCDDEISIYESIARLTLEFSPNRELTKARMLIEKVNSLGKIIAFDAKVITLEYLKSLILTQSPTENVLVATGIGKASKEQAKDYFGLQTTHKENLIGLFSDAMAEGINLPAARAVVLLDMPSVLRIIEQRIGRIERMDSEHDQVYALWPDDSEYFSLKGDRRIVDILIMTDNLIGGNVNAPDKLYDRHLKDVNNTRDIIKKFEENRDREDEWEGVKDSTESLYSLIEGPGALITPDLYKQFADVDATVNTAISFVETDRTFSFFAFRGEAARSAKWLFIDERNKAYTDFGEIASKLIEYLGTAKVISRKWDQVHAGSEINKILIKLRSQERKLLPPKKRRALQIGERLLTEISSKSEVDRSLVQAATHLLNFFNPTGDLDGWIDYNHFAELWLSVLLPALDTLRNQKPTRKWTVTLGDIKDEHVNLNTTVLNEMLENCRYASTLDELIASCIIGIPKTAGT